MIHRLFITVLLFTFCTILSACHSPQPHGDVLPSWNEGDNKAAITRFVLSVTDEASPDYVPAEERIAVFDNDGTLWAEQPAYFQLFFGIDRVRAMAGDHPEWRTTQPFKAAIEGDMKALAASGHEGLFQLVAATHANLTAEQFQEIAELWLDTAQHPRFDVPYRTLVYQPQLELLDYLRAHGFTVFIVSGGGSDFVRALSMEAYGIPPHQVVGSSLESTFEMSEGKPVILKQPGMNFINDKEGKPVGIHQYIGQRPVLAVGNSDGDLQMLQYTTIGNAPALGILIRHDDAEREYAYDRDSKIGKLDQALDEAPQRGWVVVSMKQDWKQVFPGK